MLSFCNSQGMATLLLVSQSYSQNSSEVKTRILHSCFLQKFRTDAGTGRDECPDAIFSEDECTEQGGQGVTLRKLSKLSIKLIIIVKPENVPFIMPITVLTPEWLTGL